MPITCAQCSDVEVFYATGIIRFRLTGTISGSSYKYFYFYNFPSSAYSFAN